ncbi:copper homeostasis membrane protein CopD [Atlantibacter sp.]|uniref:copper homeostasis membrane protein CopD n=1 Tax=Atlantibacter sp. TaxID=1903473 RepID=UPI00289CC12B|nr:copper homeostasis membrane protein CopD [Atlantibacter sp.]
MLDATWIALRFLHFVALILALGCAISTCWLASDSLRPVLARRLWRLWGYALGVNVLSASFMLCIQGGMMGGGWADTFSPAIWQAVLTTQFGGVWLWQIILSAITLAAFLLKPRRVGALLMVLLLVQIILLAGVGHAVMAEGGRGVVQRVNHAVHLLSAAWWMGGLLPLLACMRLARKARWRDAAIRAMMRFSRYGHLAVALAILTGGINTLLIAGVPWPPDTRYLMLLWVKIGLVAIMVAIALYNRYFLVPRFTHSSGAAQREFLTLVKVEWIVSLLVVACVSLFATWEPV